MTTGRSRIGIIIGIGIVSMVIGAVPAEAQTVVTMRDEFSAISYAGNDGTRDFAGPWRESGESDGPAAGSVRVTTDDRCAGGSGNCLRLGSEGGDLEPFAVDRSVGIEGATEATLRFTWRRNTQGQVNGAIRVRVSDDGGNSWTTLTTIPLAGAQRTTSQAFDITGWAAAATVIRFDGAGTGVSGYVVIDDVQVQATTTDAPTTTTTTAATTTTTTTTSSTTTSVAPGTSTSTTSPGPGTTTSTSPGATTSTTPPTTSTSPSSPIVSTDGASTTAPTTSTTTDGSSTVADTNTGASTTTAPVTSTGPDDLGDPTVEDAGEMSDSDTPALAPGPSSEAAGDGTEGDRGTVAPLALVAVQAVLLGLITAILIHIGVGAGTSRSDS